MELKKGDVVRITGNLQQTKNLYGVTKEMQKMFGKTFKIHKIDHNKNNTAVYLLNNKNNNFYTFDAIDLSLSKDQDKVQQNSVLFDINQLIL